jgi:hypothetical protein
MDKDERFSPLLTTNVLYLLQNGLPIHAPVLALDEVITCFVREMNYEVEIGNAHFPVLEVNAGMGFYRH